MAPAPAGIRRDDRVPADSRFRRPDVPGGEHPTQLHLDFDVADLHAGESAVLAIGARLAPNQPDPTEFRVYLDPAGHPFCLVRAGG